MRFKAEIWEYWRKFEEEERLNQYRKERGREFLPLAEGMDEAVFARLLNTYRWLTKLINNSRIGVPVAKSTTADILEALGFIRLQGSDLLAHAKKHRDVELRRGLTKKAKKWLACVEYYTGLVEQGFFDDKEINLEQELQAQTEVQHANQA